MKTGIIDIGGGLRDIYGLGIFDYCMDHDISFDLCIGISAGSANVVSFMAGQRGRNYAFYTEYPFRKEYMSFGNFLKKGLFLDLDYVYRRLSNSDGENPLDYLAFARNPAKLIIVATEAATGKPVYFTKSDVTFNHYDALKSSSAIPFICKPYETSGISCYDGALSDPIPVAKAFEEGCDKVILILTRPKDAFRTQGSDAKIAAMIHGKYPKAAEAMKNRYLLYNRKLEEALKLEEEGKILILAPDSIEGMKTLKRDVPAMEKLYQKGMQDAAKIPAFLAKTP